MAETAKFKKKNLPKCEMLVGHTRATGFFPLLILSTCTEQHESEVVHVTFSVF